MVQLGFCTTWSETQRRFSHESAHISATLRIAGALEKSTDVMKSMQALIKIPEIQATMRDMSKEMMKVHSSYFPKLWECGKQCRSGSDCF